MKTAQKLFIGTGLILFVCMFTLVALRADTSFRGYAREMQQRGLHTQLAVAPN